MKKILLVDDEDSMITFLRPELQFEGYAVEVANDGLTAWDTFNHDQSSIDLIILDWMLPRLDGLEVMRRIRKVSDIPIIMMTARDYVGDRVAGLDNGADDYITKPFEIEELLARIRVILRREDRRGGKRQLQVANLVLDTKSRQATADGVSVQLTQREAALLAVLMRKVGETMTRDELLDAVWGDSFEGQVNIVDVYIRYLRTKMKDFADVPRIQTIRGVGYTLPSEVTA
ncbi:winged helix family two component transcriptional regulator [Lacticaseibacillus pantheris DSM 15945 = JCM 12539 = NBRC 106106]|uniref:Winged helix family two component transcriptional regulator n=1 Tax=Lacticaseibacillus pantheris DSM 15945 = JCM 12539 = NBRC 106106 TaxID=1423783 RepID=A0A0R1U9V2_9LACO|nr:response regulator transcription factor [Lacticaseibacillus pantheris]KRL87618.1 winged helix family two component transcriptional regulator [Lacticaseibacillus pantheris DSM 15945 = JCM 12539 = NBRC 106106]